MPWLAKRVPNRASRAWRSGWPAPRVHSAGRWVRWWRGGRPEPAGGVRRGRHRLCAAGPAVHAGRSPAPGATPSGRNSCRRTGRTAYCRAGRNRHEGMGRSGLRCAVPLESRPPVRVAMGAAVRHLLAIFASIITPALVVCGLCGIAGADAPRRGHVAVHFGGGDLHPDSPSGRTVRGLPHRRSGDQFQFHCDLCGDGGGRLARGEDARADAGADAGHGADLRAGGSGPEPGATLAPGHPRRWWRGSSLR